MSPFSSNCTTQWISLSLLSLCIVGVRGAWSAAEPRIVHGQRCLLVPPSSNNNNNKNNQLLPIVLIGGLGQTISSYIPHLPTLAKDRAILLYECRGQGRIMTSPPPHDYYQNVTIPFQAEQLLHTVNEVLGNDCKFHVVGFSLGARIAMAAACLNDEDKIQGLILTGIATEPSPEASIALYAWKQLLHDDNVQGFCWNALQTTYSSDFLFQNQKRLVSWIETMCDTNSPRGMQALLQQAYPQSQQDPWHVSNMATRLAMKKKKKKNNIKGLLIAGELDVMAPESKVEQLASLLEWKAPIIIPNCGHAVPMEAGRTWRQAVLEFLTKLES